MVLKLQREASGFPFFCVNLRMKKIILLCFLFAACSPEDLSKKAAEEIMATDKAMSKTVTEIGFNV